MAHFAKIGSSNKVIQVVVLNNNDMLNADGIEDETVGQQKLQQYGNWPAQMWIQTSYNTSGGQHNLGGTPLRGNYAGIGYTWDEDNNIFWPIGDAPALTSGQESQNTAHTNHWYYAWNEANTTWDLIDQLA